MQIHFVDTIPKADAIESDHLYISLKYNMTSHRCASGCGQLVPLPLSPADWSLSYNGEFLSLHPSVGNGVLNCRSHYLIKNSQVVWLSNMSALQTQKQQEIDSELLKLRMDKRTKGKQKKTFLSRLDDLLRNIFSVR